MVWLLWAFLITVFPRDIIKCEYDQITKLGIDIKYNTNVGTDISLKTA